jgi:hypothetical protein
MSDLDNPPAEQRPHRHPSVSTIVNTIVLIWIAIPAVVLALAAGLSWRHLLHWGGELLLIAGILLAAKGIRDVRRAWTTRPGLWGHLRQLVREYVSLAIVRSLVTAAEVAPGTQNIEERVTSLEHRVGEIGTTLANLVTSLAADDERLEQQISELAGFGLNLQAGGVACLLAGTILLAIY